MTEDLARAMTEIPGPAGHIWPAIDDRERQHDPVGWVAEGHERPAWQRPVGDPDKRLGQGLSARGAVAIQPRPVPRDVWILMPRVLADGSGGRDPLGWSNLSHG